MRRVSDGRRITDRDRFGEECAVFGIFGSPDAGANTALGLHALQHRGQEATGIVSWDGRQFRSHRGLGHVADNFGAGARGALDQVTGHAAIGHNRYSTTGGGNLRNVQPLFAETELGGLALSHNGNLTNAQDLRRNLVRQGCLFQSTTDTEIIIHLIARSPGRSQEERIIDALHQVEGAYSLVLLTPDSVIGVRDPLGVRPLVLGQLGDAMVLASETCAFDILGARFVRDVQPGEMVILSADGVDSLHPFPARPDRFCIFEYIYFSRPDSIVEGRGVYEARKAIGSELACESPVDVDIVVPIPDSGVPAAIGYSERSGIRFELGIVRNHYVGRTFIQPSDQDRHLGVRLKHSANRAVIDGKRVLLIDDSIVRGTTSTRIVEMVRAAGAREVHMRVASPPTTHSCFYGVDTPERDKLLAARFSVDEIGREIGVDSLAFVSIDGLYRAMGEAGRHPLRPRFCDACFTGEYPIRLRDRQEGMAPKQLSLLTEFV